jgi:hypothetical protein
LMLPAPTDLDREARGRGRGLPRRCSGPRVGRCARSASARACPPVGGHRCRHLPAVAALAPGSSATEV